MRFVLHYGIKAILFSSILDLPIGAIGIVLMSSDQII